jgi:uridine kinase
MQSLDKQLQKISTEIVDLLHTQNRIIAVGVTGAVCAGKSTVTKKLSENLRDKKLNVILLNSDWYIKQNRLERNKRMKRMYKGIIYDTDLHLNTWLDTKLMIKHITSLKNEKQIFKSNGYNIANGELDKEINIIPPLNKTSSTVLLVEGKYLLYKNIHKLFDLAIYTESSRKNRTERLKLRDPHKKGLITELMHIYSIKEKLFLRPYKKIADIIVHNNSQ